MASSEVDVIMRVLREQGEVETRLRETSSGDREYLQGSGFALISPSTTEERLITTLHDLASKGVVSHTSTVHPHDSSEYISCWRLTSSSNGASADLCSLNSIDLAGKTLVLRVDFNCPVSGGNGHSSLLNTRRIDDHAEKTIAPLMRSPNRPRAVVLLAHQGRVGHDDFINLRLHERRLAKVLHDEKVSAKTQYIWQDLSDSEVAAMGPAAVASDEVLARIRTLPDNSILLLENVRFDDTEESFSAKRPDEYRNCPLIKMLSKVENIVVGFDGFSVAHRAQPSVVGLASLGPLYAGAVVLQEAQALSKALVDPARPMLLVVGGAKVDDSLFSIEKFLEDGKASRVLTGGIVALVFLLAQDRLFNKPTMKNILKSTGDLDKAIDKARSLLHRHRDKIAVPSDLAFGPSKAVASDDRDTYRTDDLDAGNRANPTKEVGDIGVRTVGDYIHQISLARTIVMNGTMGHYELPCFVVGTHQIMTYTAFLAHDSRAHVLIGGGDTGAALGRVQAMYARDVHVSSSGKAFLQVLSTGDINTLPGIRVLARCA